MPGLSLRTGFGVGANYSPLSVRGAQTPSAPQTIAQSAYGISGDGATPSQVGLPAYGSISVGVVCTMLLVYLWWSLPR